MAFGKLTVTSAGRALLARATNGEPFALSHLTVGDGYYSGAYSDIAQAVSPLYESPFVGFKRLGNEVTVTADISNGDTVTGYYMRELAIYARDSGGGYVLFAYDNAGAEAEYIQSGTGSIALDSRLSFVFVMSESAQVTIEDTGGMYLLENGDASDTTVTFGPDDGMMTSGDRLGVMMAQAARLINELTVKISEVNGRIAALRANGLYLEKRVTFDVDTDGWEESGDLFTRKLKVDGLRTNDEVLVSIVGGMRDSVLLMGSYVESDGVQVTLMEIPDAAIQIVVRVYRVGSDADAAEDPDVSLTGLSEAANRLYTPRRIEIAGDAQGETVFDGSRDVAIYTAVETIENTELEDMLK